MALDEADSPTLSLIYIRDAASDEICRPHDRQPCDNGTAMLGA